MVPPAPVTFSMTTGCPSDWPMRSPTTRAITSVGPPAANGTTMVIGRDGKDCAAALPAKPDIAATAVVAKTSLRIGMVRSLDGGLRQNPAPNLADPKPLAAAARSLYMRVIPRKGATNGLAPNQNACKGRFRQRRRRSAVPAQAAGNRPISAPGRPPDQGFLPDRGSRAIGRAGHQEGLPDRSSLGL